MEHIIHHSEYLAHAVEQAPLRDVLLYTHNATNAFDEGDPQRIDAYMARLRAVDPDAGFLSEAYLWQNASDSHLQHVLERFGELGYKAVIFDYSEADRQDRHGAILFARHSMVDMAEGYRVLELNGRRALLMALRTPSGTRFNMIGAHANDHQARRAAETQELLAHYGAEAGHAVPVVLLGDLNSAVDTSPLAQGIRTAGRYAAKRKRLAALAAEQEAGRRSAFGRLASLAIRAGGQMEGDTIRMLMAGGLSVTANTDHLRTSYVPNGIPSIARHMLDALGLDKPYIEADYMLTDRGSFGLLTRHDRLQDDEHAAISARYCPEPAAQVR